MNKLILLIFFKCISELLIIFYELEFLPEMFKINQDTGHFLISKDDFSENPVSYNLKIVLFINYVASTFLVERGKIPDLLCLV